MDPAFAIDIGQQALYITMLISAPMLITGLLVGLFIGVLQAVTQIHEMTLTFIPKILAMIAVLILTMPWMLTKLIEYTMALFNQIPSVGGR